MKRLALYVFWEKDGIVRDFVTYYLKELKKVTDDILVIVNGKLSPGGRKKLEAVATDILVRENKGIDFAAWKAGIEYLGWKKIEQYDELVLTNCSCYGPVYPFKEMFDKMDKTDCDFWGITRHPEMDVYLCPDDEKSKIVEHVQSFFLVFRKHILCSNTFKQWWNNLEKAKNYNEEIAYHETKFTAYLENAGFVSAVYVDFDKYDKLLKDNATIHCSDRLLIEDRNPLVKRKALCCPYINILNNAAGEQGRKILDFIEKDTNYDVNLIWDDLLATQKMSDLRNNLHLNYVLPSVCECPLADKPEVALILYIYYEDLIEYCYRYALSMPEYADIYVITCNDATKKKAQQKFKGFPCRKLEFRQTENRGRDVAVYLVVCADIFAKYDYVCCMHDKKSPYFQSAVTGEGFADHCFDYNMHNRVYVNNIISLFENKPRLGMLCPPLVHFGIYYDVLGNEVTIERPDMEKVYKKLGMTVPFDDNPLFPCGTMFWVRGKAFLPLVEAGWKFSDFPPEPNPNGGTILHALERLYPLIPQQAGYFTASVMPETKAEIYLDNQQYMLRSLNLLLFKRYGRRKFCDLINYIKHDCGNVPAVACGGKGVVKDAKYYLKNKLRYYKFKLLSHLPLGKKKKYYKQKKKEMKERLRFVRGYLKK